MDIGLYTEKICNTWIRWNTAYHLARERKLHCIYFCPTWRMNDTLLFYPWSRTFIYLGTCLDRMRRIGLWWSKNQKGEHKNIFRIIHDVSCTGFLLVIMGKSGKLTLIWWCTFTVLNELNRDYDWNTITIKMHCAYCVIVIGWKCTFILGKFYFPITVKLIYAWYILKFS